MTSPIPLLETERLRLRPFEPADAAEVGRLAGAAELAATTLNIPHPYPAGLAETWIKGHGAAAADGRLFTWAIERKADGALMGAISLSVNAAHARGEIGYWLGVLYWNQGYMTEAARRVIAHGFGELGLNRIHATALPHNVGSWRVMEKAGMRYEGLLRGYYVKGSSFMDVRMYAVLRADFMSSTGSMNG